MNDLQWLQDWYARQCDGDWGHSWGVRVTTLDNPGWRVSIHLEDTELEGKAFTTLQIDRMEEDWIYAKVENNVYEGVGGALNLTEIFGVFREWTEANEWRN